MTVGIEQLLARAEITEVLTRYARGVDRGDWGLVRSCYHRDAHDDHGLYKGDLDGLIEFMTALTGRLDSTAHQLGNVLIDLDPGGAGARVEAYRLGVYRRTGHAGTAWTIVQGLRYLDRLERRDDRWAITRRVVVLDWEQAVEAGGAAPIPDGWHRRARGHRDLSHDHLAVSG